MNDLFARESISEQERDCYLCLEYLSDPHTLSCHHRACKSCLVSSIRNSVREGQYPIPCFMPNCTGKVTASECSALLTDDLDKCLKKIASLEESALIPENRRGNCPACRKVYDKHDYPFRSISNRCRRCGLLFCPW